MAPKPKTGPIDDAEAWIIENYGARYADAAERWGVTQNAIRSRIANKYGSLSAARLMRDAMILKPDRGRTMRPVRRCICCGISAGMDRNQRICDTCQTKNARVHDGRV